MITLDTVFTETLLDKNNERVTDINAGLKKFYPQMIYRFNEISIKWQERVKDLASCF